MCRAKHLDISLIMQSEMTEVRNINFNYEKDSVLYSGPWKYLNTCHRINLSIYYMYYITVGIILVKLV